MENAKSVRRRTAAFRASLLPFDPVFYKNYYKDLGKLDALRAMLHYLLRGRREGRSGSYSHLLNAEQDAHGILPDDFDPATYLRLNPDLKPTLSDPWRPALHYLRHGAAENRRYAPFDSEVYAQLYRSGESLSLEALIADSARHPTRFRNWADLTEAYDVAPGRWLEFFNVADVQLATGRRLDDAPPLPQAVERFLAEDINQLAPIRIDLVFDPSYAREIRPDPELTDVALYRDWLSRGVGSGVAGSASARLRQLNLNLRAYPQAFDWRRHAQDAPAADRWSVLATLVNDGPASDGRIHVTQPAVEFLVELARAWIERGHLEFATTALLLTPKGDERADVLRAMTLLQRRDFAQALSIVTAWRSCAAVESLLLPAARLADHAGETSVLIDLLSRTPKESETWRKAALEVGAAAYRQDDRTLRAKALQLVTPKAFPELRRGFPPVVLDPQTDADQAISALIGASRFVEGAGRETLDRARVRATAEALAVPPFNRDSDPVRPRVLLVNTFFPPQELGGATIALMRNILDWRASGRLSEIDLAVVCSDETVAHGQILPDTQLGVPVFRIGVKGAAVEDESLDDAITGESFRRILSAFEPDLVHFHSVQRLSPSVVAACSQVAYIITLHDGWWISEDPFFSNDDGQRVERPRSNRLRQLLRGAYARIAVSPWIAEAYGPSDVGPVLVIENGAPVLAQSVRRSEFGAPLRIGFVGGRWRLKGYSVLRAALQGASLKNLCLKVVDQNERCSFQSEELWGSTPVTIVGRRSNEDMKSFYAEIDVLAAPSMAYESYGLAVREALQAGLWVIVSDRGALADVVREGENGFIVSVDDVCGLQHALWRLDHDPTRFMSPPSWRPHIPSCSEQAELVFEQYSVGLASVAQETAGVLKRRLKMEAP